MAKLEAGHQAPAFTLPDDQGKMRDLEEFLDRPLVLYFYPGDFTPGCTREACQFEDAIDTFEDAGVNVVGISQDPPGKHAAFRKKHDLSFPLLADEEGEVQEAYGANGFFRTKRVTFLIAPDGTVLERVSSLLPGTHIRKALERFAENGHA